MSIARCYALLGRWRDIVFNRDTIADGAAEKLVPQDITYAEDIGRICLQWEPVAGLPHHYGDCASEAAMLALHNPELAAPRYVLRGDTCRRTDLPGSPTMLCIAGNGTAAADWITPGNYQPAGSYQAAGDYQPLSVNLSALAAGSSTIYGRGLLLAESAADLSIEVADVDGIDDELAALAPLDSPALTGSPTAPDPTAAQGIATKVWVEAQIAASGGVSFGVSKDGLEHWWELPWLTSAHTDRITPSLTGTISLLPGVVPGRWACGLTSSYLTLASAASVQVGTGSFSVAAWCRLTTTATQAIIGKWGAVLTDQEWYINITSGHPTMALANDSATAILTSSATLAVGSWAHIVGVWDEPTLQSRIYVDGVLTGSLDIAAGVHSTTYAVRVGSSGSTPTTLGDLSIWHRVLTPDEIAYLAQRNGTRFH